MNTTQPVKQKTRAPVRKTTSPSPWQVLVKKRIEELGLTSRALAQAISTGTRSYYHTTVWMWLRNVEGTPPKDTYTPALNAALAEALRLPDTDLAAAYDISRANFGISATSNPTKRLALLRRMVEESARETWTRQDLLDRIDELLNL